MSARPNFTPDGRVLLTCHSGSLPRKVSVVSCRREHQAHALAFRVIRPSSVGCLKLDVFVNLTHQAFQ